MARLPIALLQIGLFLLCAVAWLTLAHTRFAGPLRKTGLSALLRAVECRIVVHSAPHPVAGTLFVANHMSWLDIVVLARVLDAGFVAKREVAGWPLLGTLARRAGCLFVSRENRSQSALQAGALVSALAAGRGFILFPEGTTGAGDTVLPFRSSLFPQSGGVPVQPVAVIYRGADGAPLNSPQRRRIAWLDDDALLPHFLALLGAGGCRAEIWFESAIVAPDRKQAAAQSHAAIAARLGEAGITPRG